MYSNRFIAALIALVATLMLNEAAYANLQISINKSTQHMTVTVDGRRLYDWPVSTGGRGYDTPNGSFKPFRMEIDHHSDEWDDAPMPYSIFFTKIGHAIHGTDKQRNLGRPVSHGCVRLSVKNAATPVGTGEAAEDGKHHRRADRRHPRCHIGDKLTTGASERG
jgi:hypothetical protein